CAKPRAQAGIDPARLVFAARRAHAEYLGLFRHADLLLDTHPYNAHTTASDALYSRLPGAHLPRTQPSPHAWPAASTTMPGWPSATRATRPTSSPAPSR
ncbi:TPR domain protein, partial [mine drainage metagenome]